MKHGYPRPQLRRQMWKSLNGTWEFALDPDQSFSHPSQVKWQRTIEVPFAPDCNASGVGYQGYFMSCWYRRKFDVPRTKIGKRVILHFEAVDYRATVWINGTYAGSHEGGYTPFSFDITGLVANHPEAEIVVQAEDDPHDLAKPRGKQDWLLEPHLIWYPRTSGIWQTVWLEVLPATAIAAIRWYSSLENWEIGMEANLDGDLQEDLRLNVKLTVGNIILANDTYQVVSREITRQIALPDPGIDDYRNELLWSPPSPTLIGAEIQLWRERGVLIDWVWSYTAIRSLTIQGSRIVLNGRPYPLRLVLDQGYWPESGMTAPSDEALRQDVILAKQMGFNGVRKHQKIETPRYLFWADCEGLLVWEEMPSAYRFTPLAVNRLIREWMEVIKRDFSHPCIVAWVPFNESWGVPNLPEIQAQRHYVQALYHLTKTLDGTRLVVGNDGWESLATDIVGIHDYDEDPQRLAKRYESDDILPNIFKRERPGGRLLTLEGHQHQGQPIVLTEFGGISVVENNRTWGHSHVPDAKAFAETYRRLLEAVRSRSMFSGFCYTQFADTYQETNGLLYADRTPKIPLDEIALATRGVRTQREEQADLEWKQRMEKFRREQKMLIPEEVIDDQVEEQQDVQTEVDKT